MSDAREFLKQFVEIENECKDLYNSPNIKVSPEEGYDKGFYCNHLLLSTQLIIQKQINESLHERFISFNVNGILIFYSPSIRQSLIDNILRKIKN